MFDQMLFTQAILSALFQDYHFVKAYLSRLLSRLQIPLGTNIPLTASISYLRLDVNVILLAFFFVKIVATDFPQHRMQVRVRVRVQF